MNYFVHFREETFEAMTVFQNSINAQRSLQRDCCSALSVIEDTSKIIKSNNWMAENNFFCKLDAPLIHGHLQKIWISNPDKERVIRDFHRWIWIKNFNIVVAVECQRIIFAAIPVGILDVLLDFGLAEVLQTYWTRKFSVLPLLWFNWKNIYRPGVL